MGTLEAEESEEFEAKFRTRPAPLRGAADLKADASAAGPLLDVWMSGGLRTGGLENWRTGGPKDWRTGCLEDWELLGLQNEVLGVPWAVKCPKTETMEDVWAAK